MNIVVGAILYGCPESLPEFNQYGKNSKKSVSNINSYSEPTRLEIPSYIQSL